MNSCHIINCTVHHVRNKQIVISEKVDCILCYVFYLSSICIYHLDGDNFKTHALKILTQLVMEDYSLIFQTNEYFVYETFFNDTL